MSEKRGQSQIVSRRERISGVKVSGTVKMKAILPPTNMHVGDEPSVDTQQLMKVFNGIRKKTLAEKLNDAIGLICYASIAFIAVGLLGALLYYLLY